MERSGNIIGRQLAILRNKKNISQAKLALLCQKLGWDVSRDVLARIEIQVRAVTDKEIVVLGAALGVAVSELLTPHIARISLGASQDIIPPKTKKK